MSRLDEFAFDVMAGHAPAIHAFACFAKDADARHRAGHDDREIVRQFERDVL
jgi:hypothetical protein